MAKDANYCALVIVFVLTLINTSLEIVDSNVIQIWSAPGSATRLPCDLAVASVRDVAMTLWFKDDDRMPIYTVDFRNGPPVHWAVAGPFGSRTHFVLNESDPSSAHLAVTKTARQDEGVYRCRVDYVDSPTRNYRVNLTVIVPPDAPRIYDSEGKEIFGAAAGPFREGQKLMLSCQAEGGKPAPDVSWYRGDERLAITKDGSVCQLLLPRLSREMANAKLQCRVEPPLLQPVVRDVTLKLYLKPQLVRVTGKGVMRAGHDRSFVCTTRGSKPAPNIDWFINSQKVDTETEIDVDGEVTKSILTIHVTREHTGQRLICRVSNPWFPGYQLEDSLKFEVMYPPVAQISLVEPSEPRLLREDENAVLMCSADAVPPASNFTFFKGAEVNLIRDDPIGGISINGDKLMISGLRRHHSSLYRCRARNSEGSALSEPLTLNVLTRPECSSGSVIQQLAGTPGGEVRARCSVTAPTSRDAGPLRFYWTYNGTKDVLPIPASNVTTTGSISTVIHGLTQDEDGDLGWLACWASNDVGNQREPCLFRILPAALPEPPTNCELSNEVLQCEPGHDGGLTQRFLLEALEVRPRGEQPQDNEISTLNDQGVLGKGLADAVYRVVNDRPQFPLNKLPPGTYTFYVYAETQRGRSPNPATLHSVDFRTSYDLDVPGSLQTMTPVPPPSPTPSDNSVALLTGAVLSLILLTILTTLCVSLVVMCKKKRPRRNTEQNAITRRSVGVSMYGGSSLTQSVVPTVVVRGHRGSRVLAARWSGVLDEAPLAVLALDTRPHDDVESSNSDADQETELTSRVRRVESMETQTDS